jgi:hypothetical protein
MRRFAFVLVFAAGLVAGALLSPLRWSYYPAAAGQLPALYRADRLTGAAWIGIGGAWTRLAEPPP